jgi:hypothetical protein
MVGTDVVLSTDDGVSDGTPSAIVVGVVDGMLETEGESGTRDGELEGI